MKESNKELFYAGTFTEYMYVIELNTKNEEFTILNRIQCEKNPSYICISDDKQYLYTANEFHKGVGGVSVYSLVDKKCPKLINTISSNTEGPCHVSTAYVDEKKFLLSASFFDGCVYVYPINGDGSLAENSCVIQHYGGGPFLNHPTWGISSQNQARAHYIIQVPGTRFVLCTDLGSDKVYVYSLSNGNLTEVGFCKMSLGSGPRHLILHPNKDTIYLINELDSKIVVLDFDADKGTLHPRQYISVLPENYKGYSWCAALHLSKDGHFLYAASRGHNSIAVFAVEDKGKRIVKNGYLTELVSFPREFQIDPSGKYLLVGNQDKNSITLNKICEGTGMPEYIKKAVNINDPACIAFL